MPIYEYACWNCQHKLEVLQKVSDDPLIDCPECSKPALKKLVSAAGFRLAGGGWYETDFKPADQQKNLAKNDSQKSEQKPSGSVESKDNASGTESKKSKDNKSKNTNVTNKQDKTKKEN